MVEKIKKNTFFKQSKDKIFQLSNLVEKYQKIKIIRCFSK